MAAFGYINTRVNYDILYYLKTNNRQNNFVHGLLLFFQPVFAALGLLSRSVIEIGRNFPKSIFQKIYRLSKIPKPEIRNRCIFRNTLKHRVAPTAGRFYP